MNQISYKTAVAFSGGANILPSLYGVAETLNNQGLTPEIIGGSSSGCIAGLFYSVGQFSPELTKTILSATKKIIFKRDPKTLWNQATGYIFDWSAGNQSKLLEILKHFFTEDHYKQLCDSPVHFYAGITDFSARWALDMIEYIDIKMLKDYKTAMDVVYASTLIPFSTEGRAINNHVYYDGGVIDHIPSPYFAKNMDIENLISVFSRPKVEEMPLTEFNGKRGRSAMNRAIEYMITRISIDDEEIADSACEKRGIVHQKLFMPYKLREDIYKLDPDLAKSFYYIGQDVAQDKKVKF